MNAVETDLRRALESSEPRLQLLSDEEASCFPAPGKWSAKQVIGHLIDSASNNHQRFVRAQFTEDLVFPGYEQDAWVSAQRYQEASWPDLVRLWHLFNLHLARVIEAIPVSVREKPRTRHNLHELAWRPVAQSEATTLEYFIRDYVEHLKHHLASARTPAGPPASPGLISLESVSFSFFFRR